MKITSSILRESLEKHLAPVYVLFGAESFLIEESAALIRQRVRREGETEHLVILPEGDVAGLLCQLAQPSLFTPFRLIDIRITKLDAALSTTLFELLQILHDNTMVILIQTGILNSQQQKAKWFIQAAERGIVVSHWPPPPHQFPTWVLSRAKQRGIALSAQRLHLLLENVQGNCLAAAQEIEILALAGEDGDHPFSQQCQFDVFDLCEAALEQQPAQVIKIISVLKGAGVALSLILWALGQTLHALVRPASSQEEKIQQLFKAGIRSRSHPVYLRANKLLGSARWTSLIPDLFHIDKQIKSGEAERAWRGVLEISLKLAGVSIFPNFSVQNNQVGV